MGKIKEKQSELEEMFNEDIKPRHFTDIELGYFERKLDTKGYLNKDLDMTLIKEIDFLEAKQVIQRDAKGSFNFSVGERALPYYIAWVDKIRQWKQYRYRIELENGTIPTKRRDVIAKLVKHLKTL